MRIFLVIGETSFYQPNFVADLLRNLNKEDEIVGGILVTKAPPKADLNKYIAKNFYFLRPLEILKLGLSLIHAHLFDIFGSKFIDGDFYSVKSVYETFGVDYFELNSSINKKEVLDKIRKTNPDVIVSSNPLIFKEEILKLPKICCINRHSSLLPKYGGLWPIFHAVRQRESYTGVSVHTMVHEIDKGIILAQYRFPVYKNDSVSDLYSISFRLSALAVLDALDKIRKNDFLPVQVQEGVEKEHSKPSYFSNPTKEDWKEFRKNGGKF